MKWIYTAVLSTTMLTAFPLTPLYAESADGLETVWDCPQADGTSVYTNREGAGCQAMTLTPLSVVPDVGKMPPIPRATTDAVQHRDSLPRPTAPRADRPVPGWAHEWYSSIAPSGSVQDEVCSLYSEWMHLVQKTRGGMFFGSDPSYGGELSARNQRGPSYSFYDNTRYVTLSRLFGRGFIPIGCP